MAKKQSPSPAKELPESLTDDEAMETEEATDSESRSETEIGESDSETEPPPPASASAPPAVAATGSGSESGESDSETEAPPPPPVPASASAPPVVAATGSGSEDGSETDESESETEAPPPPPAPASASASAPPVVVATGSGSESDSESELPPPPPAPVASPMTLTLRKRPSEVTASTDLNATATKRTKTGTEETDNSGKKAFFQRVWTKEDEIELLQGILNFKNQIGKVPSRDYYAVYETVIGSNYLEEKSYGQYSSKITTLKKKYLNENKTFINVHDLKCLDLCKEIWENDLVISSRADKFENDFVRVDGESDWFEKSKLVGDLTRSGVVDEVALKEKWSLVSVKMKKKLEEKWKVLQARDFERLMLRNELVYKVSSAISKVENDSVRVDGESDWFIKSKLVAELTSSGVIDEVEVKEKWSLVSVEMKKKLEDKWKVLRARDFESLTLRRELLYQVSSAII